MPAIDPRTIDSRLVLKSSEVCYIPENTSVYEYFDTSNWFITSSLSFLSSSEAITILLIFNFLEFIILSLFSELIWPTQHFNKKHSIGFKAYRLRTYAETVVKLRNYSFLYKLFNKMLKKHYLK